MLHLRLAQLNTWVNFYFINIHKEQVIGDDNDLGYHTYSEAIGWIENGR